VWNAALTISRTTDCHGFNKIFSNLENSIIWLISGKQRGKIRNFCIIDDIRKPETPKQKAGIRSQIQSIG
jgi:hypothetical protein